ncbi:DUF4194 domain-containing protein [Thalassoglobus polymorphus]|uniref:DUF4194 domain-containing protein n=1 Tax=Thalassoglobus polymorphus TaxID=2527994 RepID=A0A517QKU6_9PLAN|nr:DUF4194 domain-containing protein [Thalassoglobus polymorphus]QDT32221.1 hypothetical protein Mal48_14640 [Thalassoglobus polymorphus]
MPDEFPQFQEFSIPAVLLLRGVVYAEDERVWNLLLSNASRLTDYFARLGLVLIVNESEGMAFLRQMSDEETPNGYDAIPKLFHTSRLSYKQSILSVLLRDEYRRFEEEEAHDEKCVVDESALFDQWKALRLSPGDDVKQLKEMRATFKRLDDFGFVRRFSDDPPTWEVRRILKARLPAAELESLKDQLLLKKEEQATDRISVDEETA